MRPAKTGDRGIGESGSTRQRNGADPVRPIVYPIADRPDVEVNVEGTWHYGVLRSWVRHDDGAWWAQVRWSRAPGENILGTFPADAVRPMDAPATD